MTTNNNAMPTLPAPDDVAMPRLELPGLLMRRALVVAALCVILILILGVWRIRIDTLREMEASLDLARASQILSAMRDGTAEEELLRLRQLPGLRHLDLSVEDQSGRVVAQVADEESNTWLAQSAGPLTTWLGTGKAAPPAVRYALPLRDGQTWTVVFRASPDSEVLEATSNLLGLLLLLIAFCAALLAAVHLVVHRSLGPLRVLVEAIAGVGLNRLSAVKTLPAMPVRELEAIAQALRHLVLAQERSEAARRVLAHRVMSLQEDERQRLARDLHDEFGQRLTALRVDASWLLRAAVLEPKAQQVVSGMAEQVALIQNDVRQLLARLRPLGAAFTSDDAGPQTLGRLRSMLHELVAGWTSPGSEKGPVIGLDFPADDDELPVTPGLALGLYRITQEALTNVVRHAEAARAIVEIRSHTDADGHPLLRWSVSDDGRGLPDLSAALQRGTGLVGLKDRIWTLGGEFDATPGIDGRGLALRAEFRATSGATV